MENKIYGKNACLNQFKQIPTALIKAYLKKEMLGPFSAMTAYCVKNKLAYHVVEDADLIKISGSEHHEGVCLVVKSRPAIPLERYLEISKNSSELILSLQEIKNPHNLGAIIRSAAHYGVKAVIVSSVEVASSGPCYRTAEGGRSSVEILTANSLDESFIAGKKYNYTIVATNAHKGESVYNFKWPKKTILLLGEEKNGLSKEALSLANRIVTLPGSGAVESLNVSCAASVLMSEYWRGMGDHVSGK